MVWRYSINDGEHGGIVIAANKERAIMFVRRKYPQISNDDVIVWNIDEDDFYDVMNPYVMECY